MPSTWQAGVGIATSTSNEAKAVEESNEKLRKLMAEREGIVKVYGGDLKADAVKGPKTKETPDSDNEPGHYVSAANKAKIEAEKKVQKDLDAITAEYETKRTKAKEDYLNGDIATQEEYNRKIEDLQLEELNKKLEVAGIEPKKRAEIEKKILDYKVKLYDQLREIEQSFGDTEAEQLAHELDTIKQKYDQDLALLNNLHDKRLISEEQYQADLKKLKERFDKENAKAEKDSADRSIAVAKKKFEKLLEEQRRNKLKEGRLDERSQLDRLSAWKKFLEDYISEMNLSADKKAAIQEEINATEAEIQEESLKNQLDMIKKYYDIFEEVVVSTSEQLGETLGKLVQGQKVELKSLLRDLLLIQLDALEKLVMIKQKQAIIEEVALHGIKGLIKAAGKIALIKGAFAAAKGFVSSFDTGGFTPAGPWNKPQGVVHSNEFVANRFATANPNVLPVLNLIDEAQRSGSVSRLSPDDIAAVIPTTQRQFASGAMASGGRSSARVSVAQGAMQAAPQDAALTAVLSRVVRSLNTLDRRFSTPIIAETYATGKHGTIEAERLVNKMKSNVSRKR